jgi:signal transduction histidine kinase
MRIKSESVVGDVRSNASLRMTNEFQTSLGVIISAGELLESYFERLPPERRRLALEDILSAAREMNQALDALAECKFDGVKR